MPIDVRKNDTVIVISGDEKGKRGRVLDVLRDRNRILIESVNMVKKHMKPSRKYSQGGIIEREAPLHRSNVMLVCPKCDKPTRIRQKTLENDKKIRECQKCGEVME